MKFLKKLPRALFLLALLQVAWFSIKLFTFEKIQVFLERPGWIRFRFDPAPLIPLLRSMSARLPWLDNCLVRGCAYALLVRWCGRPGTLQIGVRKNGENSIEAHAAMVDKDETLVLGDRADWAEFTEIMSIQISHRQ